MFGSGGKKRVEQLYDINKCLAGHEGRLMRSSSNGRTNPNSTSSSDTYVFLASRAGSEIP
jgi:hypothetical protein